MCASRPEQKFFLKLKWVSSLGKINFLNQSIWFCGNFESFQLMAHADFPQSETIQLMTQVVSSGLDEFQLTQVNNMQFWIDSLNSELYLYLKLVWLYLYSDDVFKVGKSIRMAVHSIKYLILYYARTQVAFSGNGSIQLKSGRVFPKNSFDSTHDSSSFRKYRFESTLT